MTEEKSEAAQTRSWSWSWTKTAALAALFSAITVASISNEVFVAGMILFAILLLVVLHRDADPRREAELRRKLAALSEEEKRLRKETLVAHIPRALATCQDAARYAALGSADAAELNRCRRALAEQALLQLARCNPTREELFRALAGIDPIALRDVVEERLVAGAAAKGEAFHRNGAIRLDAVDLALARRGTEEDWSWPLVTFVRSPSLLVPAPASS